MGFKQPRVPEYRENESVSKFLKALVLFLKDFCQEVWTTSRLAQKGLDGVQQGLDGISYPVTSVFNRTGDVVLEKNDLANVQKGTWDGNTSPEDIPYGITYANGSAASSTGFPASYVVILSVKYSVHRAMQILAEKTTGNLYIRSSTDGTTWGAWHAYAKKTDTVANASKLGGKAPEYYIQPRNLLDNSDFRNPVNQRGKTSYAIKAGGQYTIDRWVCTQAGTVATLTDSGVSVAAVTAENFHQKVLTKGLAGKTVTFAVKIISSTNVKIGIRTVGWGVTVSAGIPDNTSGIYTVTCTIPADTTDECIRFAIWSTATGAFSAELEWAALYEGSYTADTLPQYVPKGYGAELAECKRYYQEIGEDSYANHIGISTIQASANKYIRALIPLPVEMRANPTMTYSGTINAYASEGKTSTTVSAAVGCYKTAVGVTAVFQVAVITAATWYQISPTAGSRICLSADL